MKARPGQRTSSAKCDPPDSAREAAECSIDLAMLRDNLALSVAERLRRHDIALTTVEMLRKARRL